MKRKTFILLGTVICVVLFVVFYKPTRRFEADLDENITVKVKDQNDFWAFLDPTVYKHFWIKNKQTGATLELRTESPESDTYINIGRTKNGGILEIIDLYQGRTIYDYNTLKLLPNAADSISKTIPGPDYMGDINWICGADGFKK